MIEKKTIIKKTMRHLALKGEVCDRRSSFGCSRNNSIPKDGVFVKFLDIINANDKDFNRKNLERGKFEVLLFNKLNKNSDKLRYVNSGLDYIQAKIAKKNNIAIGYNLSEIKNKNKLEKALFLSKLMQTIKISGKTGAKIKLFGIKNKRNCLSLLTSLGSSTSKAKETISF